MIKVITPLWVAGVVVGSFLPGEAKRQLGTRPYVLHHPVAIEHRIVHILTFGVTALLFLLMADRSKDQARAAGTALLLGFGIELMQFAFRFAPVFEWWDLRDDGIGIVSAFAIFQAARWALTLG
jgi:hypothetical protein